MVWNQARLGLPSVVRSNRETNRDGNFLKTLRNCARAEALTNGHVNKFKVKTWLLR